MQVGDFGSARSATSEGYHWAEQGPPTSTADRRRVPSHHPLNLARALHQPHLLACNALVALPIEGCLSNWSDRTYHVFKKFLHSCIRNRRAIDAGSSSRDFAAS